MTDAALLEEAERAAGTGHARLALPHDDIDGIRPAVVVTPSSIDQVSSTLRWAHEAKRHVLLQGAGTKMQWGRGPSRIDVLLSFSRLDRVVTHESLDLTATIEAGAPLGRVNAALRQHRQWLPLDPPNAGRATIGGIVATNDSGPSRHRYGTPRDLLIGMTFVMADGTVASSGGRVVKNVAGYDVARLLAGSHGSLAAIVSATFKLAPLAPASRTIVTSLAARAGVTSVIDELRARQCEPEAFDVCVQSPGMAPSVAKLLLRYASVPGAVDNAIETTRDILSRAGAAGVDIVEDGAEAAAWESHERTVSAHEVVVRVSWMPASFGQAADALAEVARGVDFCWIGRAAVGSGLIGLSAPAADVSRIIGLLRASSLFAHVSLVRAPAGIRATVDVWPSPGPQGALWTALKRSCDPHDILNVGRGPL
jgi:glycolate oxidase FAD binding subunit